MYVGARRPFMVEQKLGVAPPLSRFSDEIFRRYLGVFEENGTQMNLAVYLPNGTYCDSRGAQIHEKDGDALLGLDRRVGLDQNKNPAGPMRAARPDLLAIDPIMAAVQLGPGFQG